ncbi:MAG: peptide chain release factor N(5)-glutamine methyltransferase [Solirubrobacterales bacterium]
MPAVAGTTAVREALAAAVDALAAAGVEDPRLDAELLLGEAVGTGRAALAADPGAEIPPAAARSFATMVRRRLRREPVAYIVGRRGFRRLQLAVDPRVLVPRPETELLVEVALERRPARLLDLGTGSGAIALAVADELPGCEVLASDTSAAALEVARANAARLGLAARVELQHGSLPAGRRFDLVLANLPYVAERDWPGLQPEITEWEPREALLAGADGLDAYRALFAQPSFGPQVAAAVAVEVGEGQAPAVAALARAAGFARTEARRDLAGIERVVLATTPAGPQPPRAAERGVPGREGGAR